MTCKELADILLETPELPVSIFVGNSVGAINLTITKKKLWHNGQQKEFLTIKTNH